MHKINCKASFDFEVEVLDDIPVPPPHTVHLHCSWGNQELCQEDNNLRAMWAAAAVREYVANVGGDNEPETQIRDFLSDLMHLCDALDLEFDYLLERAHGTYEPESEGRW